MTQVLNLSSRWNKFLVSLFISIQSIVFVSGRISPHNFEKFSIIPLQVYSLRCWFSNNSVITLLEGCSPSSFVAEVGIFFSILSFQRYIFYSFFRRHCDVSLFTHHLELWGSCSFRSYPFNRSVVSSSQVLFILSSFPSLFYRSALNCVQLCCVLSFFNLSRFFDFSLLSKKQLSLTSSLPLPFLSGAILDLGTRSSRSGGVLWRPKTGALDAFQGFRVSSCDLFGSLHSSLHHVHCIMSSCHHVISFLNSTK